MLFCFLKILLQKFKQIYFHIVKKADCGNKALTVSGVEVLKLPQFTEE